VRIQGTKKGPGSQTRRIEMLHRELLRLEEKAEIAPSPQVFNDLAELQNKLKELFARNETMGRKNLPGYA